mmetsp:Transcript_17076/g.53013  ORF Transcript_17076/g.53013 Transcript_17076/m.53013 type:complete len:213 (-) Transcript_17076:1870-2508(-)
MRRVRRKHGRLGAGFCCARGRAQRAVASRRRGGRPARHGSPAAPRRHRRPRRQRRPARRRASLLRRRPNVGAHRNKWPRSRRTIRPLRFRDRRPRVCFRRALHQVEGRRVGHNADEEVEEQRPVVHAQLRHVRPRCEQGRVAQSHREEGRRCRCDGARQPAVGGLCPRARRQRGSPQRSPPGKTLFARLVRVRGRDGDLHPRRLRDRFASPR